MVFLDIMINLYNYVVGLNVAFRKKAIQSPGTYQENRISYSASLAVDGNTNTDFDRGSCTHTYPTHGPASWTVQLGGSFRISGIIIYNRNETYYRDRLRSFKVVGNGRTVMYDDTISGKNLYQEEIIQIPTNMLQLFNSIKIQIPAHDGPIDGGLSILTLCEVQVIVLPPPACQILPRDILINGNVGIFGKTGSIVDGKNTAGTIVAFSCNNNYHLEGSAYIECLSSGNYNASVPKCLLSQKTCNSLSSGDMITGNFKSVRYSDRSYVDGRIAVGTIIIFLCNLGNVLEGSANIECLPSGNYNASVPKCLATCTNPPHRDHWHFVPLKPQYIEGDTVFLNCDIGFVPTNNNSIRCEKNNLWTGVVPNCIIIQCNYPGNIKNGYYTTANISVYKVVYSSLLPYETVISAVCEPGYYSVSKLSRRCQDDGTWSGQQPVCYSIVCNILAPVEHGSYFFQNRSSYSFNEVPLKTSLHIACDKGYTMQGQSKTTCIGKNDWSNQGTTCEIVTCKYPGPIKNGFYTLESTRISDNAENKQVSTEDNLEYSVKIVGKCTVGYNLKTTNASRSCLETGEWSGETPFCLQIMCKWPLQLSGGFYDIPSTYVGTGLKYNTSLTTKCNSDYILSGNRYRRCNESGDWENEQVVCEPLCKFPNVAGINNTFNRKTFYKIGESVRISCKLGYSPLTDENITCHENHEWSRNPECSVSERSQPTNEQKSNVILIVILSVVAVISTSIATTIFIFYRRKLNKLQRQRPTSVYTDLTNNTRSAESEYCDIQLEQLARKDSSNENDSTTTREKNGPEYYNTQLKH